MKQILCELEDLHDLRLGKKSLQESACAAINFDRNNQPQCARGKTIKMASVRNDVRFIEFRFLGRALSERRLLLLLCDPYMPFCWYCSVLCSTAKFSINKTLFLLKTSNLSCLPTFIIYCNYVTYLLILQLIPSSASLIFH